ncbi:hypothetical protein IFM89_035000 [Coptis chinensis]|uniref:Uncharacterized protein n=1 Tax=Coptis chinensis TaxID=261450 RepID=A0A835M864_9MAGN|nr:hypothetical protein IFM89_035000 [Coptis chinensis]
MDKKVHGRIPSGNQLQTFEDTSIYEGNPELCGPPIEKKCRGDEPSQTPAHVVSKDDDEGGRRYHSSPITPFGGNDDMSWQGEISWTFEPMGWRDGRNDLGVALSPWAASSTPLGSRHVFRHSANDYYLSHTSNGYNIYANPSSETSFFGGVTSGGRIKLQSFVACYKKSPRLTTTLYNSDSHIV